MTGPTADEVVALKAQSDVDSLIDRLVALQDAVLNSTPEAARELAAKQLAVPWRSPRPPAADAGEMRSARDLFEIMRPCFHYAKRGTPDGGAFERSETGRLLMKGCEKIALLSPTFLAENAKNEGFREGVEASAKVADGFRQSQHDVEMCECGNVDQAEYRANLAAAIRAIEG